MSSGKAALVRALKSANETLKNGDASEALRLANEAVAMDENAYEAWVVRGKCAAANGDADDAVTSYERAIGIKSDHPAAYQGLSETLEAKGDVEGRLRATRLLADATRASGKIEKYYEFMKKACAYAWKHRAWTRVVEFCGELGTIRASDVACADEETRVESLRRACEAALALRDARAAEAGEAAVQTLRSTTIASKGEESAVRALGARASYAADDETLSEALRAWLAEDAARATFDARTHLAEYERLFARLTAALSSSVDCDLDVKTCARETLAEASRLVDAWGDVALERVAESPTVVVAALELGVDCEEEGWDDVVRDADADETRVVALLEKIRDADAIANAWLTLRETGRSGAFAHSCRPVDAPRDAAGLLSDALRDDVLAHLSREDEMRPMLAGAVIGWLALAESALVGGQRGDARALRCAATAMKLLRCDVTADALPKTTRRVVVLHAEAMMLEGMFARANEVFTEVEGPRAMRGAATCALHAHPPERERALDILTAAANAYPAVARVRVEKGWLMTIAGAPETRDEALATLEEACGAAPGRALAADAPADACARLGIARWRAKVEPRKGPGSAYEALLLGAARASAYQAAAFAHLGLSRSAAGDDARARKCHARALALCPADPTSGPVAFANALNANDIREATKICREALDVDSRCAWAANRLAPMRARAGDHEGAARALQVVLRVSPRNAGAWEALGASYTVLGRHSAALKAFERALELSEDSGDGARAYAAAQTGHIQLTLGSSVDAAESYEKALSDGVDRVAALFGLARAHAHYAEGALRLGAPGRAADSLREARRAASRAVDALGESATATFWKLLGDVHHLTARVNDPAHGKDVEATLAERARAATAAVDAYEKALALSPDAPARWRDLVAALRLKTDVHVLLDDVTAAETCAEEASRRAVGYVERAPGDARAWFALASTAVGEDAASRDARAMTALSRAVAIDPTFADAWCALGRLRLSRGDVAGARDALDRARIADPSSGDAWTATAELFVAGGRLEEARGAFRTAASLGAGCEAELGCALASCASSPARARDAYACARRARERLPGDAVAAVAAALCAESRGSFTESEDAARDAIEAAKLRERRAAADGSPRRRLSAVGLAGTTTNDDASHRVASRVAEACLRRLEHRRRASASSPTSSFLRALSAAASSSSSVSSSSASSYSEDEVRRLIARCAPRNDDDDDDDDDDDTDSALIFTAARTLAASLSSEHDVVVAALGACPRAVPRGDRRARSALALARAACALNATPVIGGDEKTLTEASRDASRAFAYDPSSTAAARILERALDRRRGRARADAENHHALFERMSTAVEKHLAGDAIGAESTVRSIADDDGAGGRCGGSPLAARASARLLLVTFLLARANRDDDARPRKEARKAFAKVPEEAIESYRSVAGVARALASECVVGVGGA